MHNLVSANPLIMGGGDLLQGYGGYDIDKSLRFRSAAGAVMYRLPATVPDSGGKKWTFSTWVKRGKLGIAQVIAGSRNNATPLPFFYLTFNLEDTLLWGNSNGNTWDNVQSTTRVFRDTSAWYHIVLVFDSANAVVSERWRCYVNGVRETSFTTNTAVATNYGSTFGYSTYHSAIGALYQNSAATSPLDGYIAEVNFVDNQALTPSATSAPRPASGARRSTRAPTARTGSTSSSTTARRRQTSAWTARGTGTTLQLPMSA